MYKYTLKHSAQSLRAMLNFTINISTLGYINYATLYILSRRALFALLRCASLIIIYIAFSLPLLFSNSVWIKWCAILVLYRCAAALPFHILRAFCLWSLLPEVWNYH